ncbi:hypothetical protein AC067_10125, partial [Escherichia coli]
QRPATWGDSHTGSARQTWVIPIRSPAAPGKHGVIPTPAAPGKHGVISIPAAPGEHGVIPTPAAPGQLFILYIG